METNLKLFLIPNFNSKTIWDIRERTYTYVRFVHQEDTVKSWLHCGQFLSYLMHSFNARQASTGKFCAWFIMFFGHTVRRKRWAYCIHLTINKLHRIRHNYEIWSKRQRICIRKSCVLRVRWNWTLLIKYSENLFSVELVKKFYLSIEEKSSYA